MDFFAGLELLTVIFSALIVVACVLVMVSSAFCGFSSLFYALTTNLIPFVASLSLLFYFGEQSTSRDLQSGVKVLIAQLFTLFYLILVC